MKTNSLSPVHRLAMVLGRCGGMLWLFALLSVGAAADDIEFARAFTLADVDLDQSAVTTADQRLSALEMHRGPRHANARIPFDPLTPEWLM